MDIGDRVRILATGDLATVYAVNGDILTVEFPGAAASRQMFRTDQIELAAGAEIGSAPFGFQDADRSTAPESPGGGDAGGTTGGGGDAGGAPA